MKLKNFPHKLTNKKKLKIKKLNTYWESQAKTFYKMQESGFIDNCKKELSELVMNGYRDSNSSLDDYKKRLQDDGH